MINPKDALATLEFGSFLNSQIERQWEFREPLPFPRVHLPNHSDKQNMYMNYAYEISGHDKDFLYLLRAENGNIDPFTRSSYINAAGHREPSYGFCQVHSRFHPDVVGDERFFTDWRWQLRECYRLYKGGTVFYAWPHRWKQIKFFNFN